MMYTADRGQLRPWSPQSETYAPIDVLVQYLDAGWKPQTIVTAETFHYVSQVQIYHFVLTYGTEQMQLPVLVNPAVLRVVDQHGLVIHGEGGQQHDLAAA